MNLHSISLFTIAFLGVYFIIIGVVDITITEVSQLPWIEALIDSNNPESFDPALAILTRWIGMLLIICGATVLLITRALFKKHNEFQVFAIGILSCGVLGAQILTLATVGAPTPLVAMPLALLVIAVVAIIVQLKEATVDS